MSRRLSLLGLLGAGLIVVGAATGCASGVSSARSPAPSSSAPPASSPDASMPAGENGVKAAWLNGGNAIAVVTWGSSSCAPRSTEPATFADGLLTVPLTEATETACTRDMAPRPTFVPLPSGIDATQGLRIAVTGAAEGDGTLAPLAAPVAPEEFTPSAGWVDPSLIAILTWGSSSCYPSVETVSAEGDAIAVGFATPPADQVCTLDIGPQVSLADVGGIAGADATSVVLSGGDVVGDGPVPVIGTR